MHYKKIAFDYLKHFENKNIKKLTIQNLEFSSPDINKFTTLRLIPAMNNSKSGAIIINAANEIFVDEFLKKNIEFNDIFTYLNLVLKDRSYIKSSMIALFKGMSTLDNLMTGRLLKQKQNLKQIINEKIFYSFFSTAKF